MKGPPRAVRLAMLVFQGRGLSLHAVGSCLAVGGPREMVCERQVCVRAGRPWLAGWCEVARGARRPVGERGAGDCRWPAAGARARLEVVSQTVVGLHT